MSYYYATQILTGGTDAGTHKEGDVKNDVPVIISVVDYY